MYGRRCLFKHEDRTLEELTTFRYTHLMQKLEDPTYQIRASVESEKSQNDNLLSPILFHFQDLQPLKRLPIFLSMDEEPENSEILTSFDSKTQIVNLDESDD